MLSLRFVTFKGLAFRSAVDPEFFFAGFRSMIVPEGRIDKCREFRRVWDIFGARIPY